MTTEEARETPGPWRVDIERGPHGHGHVWITAACREGWECDQDTINDERRQMIAHVQNVEDARQIVSQSDTINALRAEVERLKALVAVFTRSTDEGTP